jgi:hypothetical protein
MTLRFRLLVLVSCGVAVGCNWLVGVRDLPISEEAGHDAGVVDATEPSDESPPDATWTDSNTTMRADAERDDAGSPGFVQDAAEEDGAVEDADASLMEMVANDGGSSDASEPGTPFEGGKGDGSPPSVDAGTLPDAAPDVGASSPADAGDAANPADATGVTDVGQPDVGLPDAGLPALGPPDLDL